VVVRTKAGREVGIECVSLITEYRQITVEPVERVADDGELEVVRFSVEGLGGRSE
jgi:hypothetical protein